MAPLLLLVGLGGCRYLAYASGQDVLQQPVSRPSRVVVFGPNLKNYGYLRVPAGDGPHPVAVILHGGCWLSIADLKSIDAVAADLAERGIATWSVEYRPVDREGRWPTMFLDVARGVDTLRDLAEPHNLDLRRVIAVGHSAGGHLALWAAARHRIPPDSPLFSTDPLPLSGVVSLAGPGAPEQLRGKDHKICGQPVLDRIFGGSPDQVPSHYAAGSPRRLLPLGVPIRFVTGADDRVIPPRLAADFVRAARAAGDDATAIIVQQSAHFEPVLAQSRAWARARAIVLELLDR